MITKTQGSSADRVLITRTNTGYANYATLDTRDTIVYDDGPQYLGGHARWKNCEHTRMLMPSAGPVTWSGENRYGTLRSCSSSYPDDVSSILNECKRRASGIRVPTAGEMLGKATEEFKGRLESHALPITDLFQLTRQVDRIRGFDELIGSFVDIFHPKSFLDLVKKSAGADLAWKWGVKPLTDTILQLVTTSEKVNNHLKKLKAIEDSIQDNWKVTEHTSHYSTTWWSRGGYDGSGNRPLQAKGTLNVRTTSQIHFRCRFRYDTSDAIRTRLAWDAMGCTNLFGTVWDLMPWSFLVDWITNVGNFADYLDSYYFHSTPLERMGEITDAWITQTTTAAVEFEPCSFYYSDFSRNVKVAGSWGQVGLLHFLRYPVTVPDISAWLPQVNFKPGDLSLSKKVTGLELAAQRLL